MTSLGQGGVFGVDRYRTPQYIYRPPALVIGETCRHGKRQYDGVQQDKAYDAVRALMLATQTQLKIDT
jgi:hypothetical protein